MDVTQQGQAYRTSQAQPSSIRSSQQIGTTYTSQPYRTSTVVTNQQPHSMDVAQPGSIRQSTTNVYSSMSGGQAYDYEAARQSIGTVRGSGVVIAVNKGQPIVKETRQGRNSVVIGQRELGLKVISESIVGQRVINETYNHLAEIVHDNRPQPRKSVTRHVDLTEEEAVFVERIVEKEVEVIIERKVPKITYKDVQYDVIVEQPIERIIEKEIEYEKIVEKEIEKTIEVPIEKIIEIPIEEVIEKKVEVIEYVDVPVERVVQRTVEQEVENVIYTDKQIDIDSKDLHLYPNAQVLPTNIETQQVNSSVPRPIFSRNQQHRVIQEEVQNVITRQVDRPVEKLVESISHQPAFYRQNLEQTVVSIREETIEKPVEHIVERPVYVKNIVKKPVAVHREQEVIEEVYEERQVIEQVPRDVHRPQISRNVVTQSVVKEVVVNKDVEVFSNVGVHLEEVTSRPLVLVNEVPQTSEQVDNVEIEYLVHKQRPVPVDQTISVQVPQFNKQMQQSTLERPVKILKIVEKGVAIETEVMVEVENKIEVPVYEEVVEERPVIVDREVIEYYDVIKQNIIEVEKVEDVDLAVTTRIQRPKTSYQTLQERVAVDKNVVVPVQGREINEGDVEI